MPLISRNARACVLGALAVLTLPAQTDPTLDQIVEKHIVAMGGAAKLKAIQSFRMTGKAVMGGGQMEAPMTLQVKRPRKSRLEMTVQGRPFVQAFDGESGWSINPFTGSTEPQPMGEDETKAARDSSDLDGPILDYKTKGHTMELIGKEDVEGTPAYRLKMTKKSGSVETHFLDAETYLSLKTIARRKIQGTDMDIEIVPSHFKPVSGVMMPHVLDQKVGGRSVIQMNVERIDANVPIDDAVFSMPKPAEKK